MSKISKRAIIEASTLVPAPDNILIAKHLIERITDIKILGLERYVTIADFLRFLSSDDIEEMFGIRLTKTEIGRMELYLHKNDI
jgi:hypothetical protein